MITLEIIIFILAVLLGIVLYWRESKSNYLFKLVNRITHSKDQQLKKEDKKGFLYGQPFLIRFVYLVVFILIIYLISAFLTSFRILNVKFFATIIVGTLLGTYFASLIVFTNDKVEDGQDIIEDALEKGKEMFNDLTEKDEKVTPKKTIDKTEKEVTKTEKSARDRLKDKGFLK